MTRWMKLDARKESIIRPYHDLTGGRDSIPPSRQYWTLAGRYTHLDRQSELVQMVDSGFITPGQYHGAEIVPEDYAVSELAFKAYPEAHLYLGDLVTHMTRSHAQKALHPEVVYVDTKREPEGASELLVRVLDICNQTAGRTFIFVNAIAINPQRRGRKRYTYEEFMEVLGSRTLRHVLREGRWQQPQLPGGERGVLYPGNDSRAKSTMLTVIFYRNVRGS